PVELEKKGSLDWAARSWTGARPWASVGSSFRSSAVWPKTLLRARTRPGTTRSGARTAAKPVSAPSELIWPTLAKLLRAWTREVTRHPKDRRNEQHGVVY